MNPLLEQIQLKTRRHFLRNCGMGLGAGALAQMLSPDAFALDAPKNPLLPRKPHFNSKAKRVIYIHLTGSPPHLDMWDYKPELVKRTDQECPDEFVKGKTFAFTSGTPKLMGTPRTFKQYGKSGMWMSDAIPNFHEHADDLCVIKSMHTDQFNHAPAELFVHTGFSQPGRPSFGAWTTYGLGSENQDLPGYVVLISSGTQPNGGKNSFSAGFIPSVYQGVQCRSKGDPVLYVSNPPGMDRGLRRASLDALRDLNQKASEKIAHPETLTRIAQYELAYRMQTSVPEVMDISKESKKTLEAYGAQVGGASLGKNCLLARRLVEKDVRFVQLFDWGWDFHGTNPKEDIRDGLTKKCATMDKPISALINDLKERGLFDETLIIIGGEFGRTPFREGRTARGKVLGRDHFPDCYTMVMAGGGVKGGHVHGESDELGFSVAKDPVHVHDLQATWMHLLGFDHEQLTYRFQGRDYRLTDVHGHVVKDLIA
ncbi:MAG: sulfatase [Opitutae bacterium]|nr:sulfatase [Opitutae bacterium]|tara:strand:- start:2330 stop:3778 length:1449 start_codon:yes stop_codon:yes gene_type:complete